MSTHLDLTKRVNIQLTTLKFFKKVLDRVFGEICSFPAQLAPACFLRTEEQPRAHGAN
jgi:hypothetical protein